MKYPPRTENTSPRTENPRSELKIRGPGAKMSLLGALGGENSAFRRPKPAFLRGYPGGGQNDPKVRLCHFWAESAKILEIVRKSHFLGAGIGENSAKMSLF